MITIHDSVAAWLVAGIAILFLVASALRNRQTGYTRKRAMVERDSVGELAMSTLVLQTGPANSQPAQNMAQQLVRFSSALQNAAVTSSLDLIQALEAHLRKYPDTNQRPAIEKALAKAAMDTNDTARIILYGERVLANEAPPDPRGDVSPVLDRVIRALVDQEDPEHAKRALALTKRYEADVAETRLKAEPPAHLTPSQWSEELDKAAARAIALEARATGYMGDQEAAAKIARESWKMYPTGEGAREVAWWLSKLGRNAEAIEFYANALEVHDRDGRGEAPVSQSRDQEG